MVNNNVPIAQKKSMDVAKYGFKISRVSDTGVFFFTRQFNEYEIRLMVAENIYSLSIVRNEHETMVANRYKIDTEQQLDFLIYNGRVGSYFINDLN